jgi:oxygen-dependent protoporphyrinogen oxidase
MTRRVAVVGGGVAGLAAAWEASGHDGVEVVVHEASDRAGGKLLTSRFAGRLVDEGADAFLARVPWAFELCRELGIDASLVSPARGNAYIWFDGALRAIPTGTVLGVPTDLDTAVASGLVGRRVEVRPADAPLAPGEDISVGTLVRSQLGDAVLERLVDPLIGGINAGNCDDLSVRAAAPQLAAAAERDRDLVLGLRAAPSPAPGPVFYSPIDGMGALIDALLGALDSRGVVVRTSAPVDDVGAVDADVVVVATPAWVTARLVPASAAVLDEIEHASVAIVTFAFDSGAVARPIDASGFLVPRVEGLLLTAASWASAKWAHLGDADDQVVVRASAGRSDDDRVSELDDDKLAAQLVDDLRTTMAVRAEPREVRVSRWPRGFPQYRPGHLARIDELERQLAISDPRVRLAGATYRGVGVPACIRSGREAAAALLT